MESLFFNTPNQCYKISNSLNTNSSIIKKVDISNGILFYDIIKNQKKRILEFNYIDKMLFFVMVVDGCIEIAYSSKIKRIKKDKIETFLNINNPFNIVIYKDTKAFILFVSDFFLKRYLSFKDGVMHGPAILYNPDGTVFAKGNYENGIKSGTWEFNMDGEMVKSAPDKIRLKK
jgi:antitoxin component YwqK of YwqJK toxin-antitoxin module